MAKLSPKQWEAFTFLEDSLHTEVLYGGSAGGGKSRLGCIWLAGSAIRYQGSRWLMGRSRLKTLKETTLKSFFDQMAEDGLRVQRDFTYNGQSHTLEFGASEIILKDLFLYPSDPSFDELGSLELTGAFVDEVNQVVKRGWDIVNSRIRYKLDEFGLTPKTLGTCNPAKNWVHSEFYKPWKEGILKKNRAFIPALVTDNPSFADIVLPDGTTKKHPYVQKLMELTGPDRERLFLGNWDYDDDPAALMDADAISDLFTNEHVTPGQRAITADVARYGSDKTVIMLWEGFKVVQVSVFQGQSIPDTAAAIGSMAKLDGVPRSRIVVDDDGIGGGVVDLLQGCTPFNGGGKVVKDENYMNLKAQCSYVLAEMVNAREIHIEDGRYRDEITTELPWVKRWKMDHDGKLAVMPKDKVKEGLGRSPDFADALMMRMVLELRGPLMAAELLGKRGEGVRMKKWKDEARKRWGV